MFESYLECKKNLGECQTCFTNIENSKSLLCLDCCFVGCGKNSQNKCSLTHANKFNHHILIMIDSKNIRYKKN